MSLNSQIKAIDKTTVGKICSGQVVLTLATAVKELLENSLDAGATSIQIKLKEYGSKRIEVIDNGSGVEECNFQGLTLKHHTSKISEFEDLEKVGTFGFRGEALSSLCSVGRMTITTRHKNAFMATRMRFDHNGEITESSNIARQVGTTVLVEDLFCTLPVRHREFLRNCKKEFCDLCQVLQAYALLNRHCSMNCSNEVGVSSRQFLDHHTGTLPETITNIFKKKQFDKLLEIKTIQPNEETLAEFRCKPQTGNIVNLYGFISSCEHGMGRSSQDRQYFYINSRPVDNPKISKLVNEIYRQYNRHQYPFVVLEITVASTSVDVNVVPDKRKIFLENDELVLATIKSSIDCLFQPIPSLMIFDLGNAPVIDNPVPKTELSVSGLSRFRAKGARETESYVKTEKASLKRSQNLTKYISRTVVEKSEVKESSDDAPSPKRSKIVDIEIIEQQVPEKSANLDKESSNEFFEEIIEQVPSKLEMQNTVPSNGFSEIEIIVPQLPEKSEIKHDEKSNELSKMEVIEPRRLQPSDEELTEICKTELEGNKIVQEKLTAVEVDAGLSQTEKDGRRKILLSTSLEDIKSKRQKRNQESEKPSSVQFHAKIDPSANKRAEDELQRALSKTSFLAMKVLGQFNKGFIITLLDSDLFIIDQHATDEKSNFESLSAKKLEMQLLTVPQSLHLDAGKEELMQDRRDVFRHNGFDFQVDESAPTTQRIKLTCVASIQGVTFDHRDVDELLFLLTDAPDGQMCRPSRVRDVIASKACRMSVMIGTALNHAQMKRIVQRMSELNQPWNCPHGRPTIRHLLSLGLLQKI